MIVRLRLIRVARIVRIVARGPAREDGQRGQGHGAEQHAGCQQY